MPRVAAALLVCLLAVLGAGVIGCGPASDRGAPDGPGGHAEPRTADGAERGATPEGRVAASDRAAGSESAGPVVIVLGDSISAGKDLAKAQAWPALVAAQLEQEGLPVRMINASESGITSRAGVERLDWLLAQEPDLLVVELGGNDGLRGQPLEAIEANLRDILQRARDAGARLLLLGMALPPNYGPEYTAGFTRLYAELAEQFETHFVPTFMEPVAGKPELNFSDGLHPNVEGHALLAEHLLPAVRAALEGIADS